MQRDCLLYKVRRELQVIASYVLPNKFLAMLYSRIQLGTWPDLSNPQTFNEKIQWLKINRFPIDANVIQCADKFRVKEYLEKKSLRNREVPLIGVWEKAEDIKWEKLPDAFVLKCNHGCAYNIVVKDKKKIDKTKISKQLNSWLKEDFGRFNVEPHYSRIQKHLILCEEFLGDKITDYKFFCFNGEPKFMYVSTDLIHDREAEIGFFNLDGSKMPIKRDDYRDIESIKLPPLYTRMLSDAKRLCEGFDFVRVDFFVLPNDYYFAEMTFTPGGGMIPFNPSEYDLKIGSLLTIKNNEE